MKPKLVAAVLCALAVHALVGASLTILEPTDGSVVDTVRPAQREFLNRPLDVCRERFHDKSAREADEKIGGRPAKVRFSWRLNGAEVVGRYSVSVVRKRDGSVFWSGASDSPSLKLDNFEIGTEYAWTVRANTSDGEVRAGGTFRTDSTGPRFVRIDNVRNVRDLGGRTGLSGMRVRQGMIYRSAGLNDKWEPENGRLGKMFLTDEGRMYAKNVLGIKTDLDLRTDKECHDMTASPLGEGVRWAHISSGCYDNFAEKEWKDAFAKCFRIFLDEKNYPIMFHCVAGADRTGSLAYVLESLLGMDDDYMQRDWMLTALSHKKMTFQPERYDRLLKVFDAMPGETRRERVSAWVRSCGFTDADIARFRSIMLAKDDASVVLSLAERLRRNLLEIGRSPRFVYAASTGAAEWNGDRYERFRREMGISPRLYFVEFRDICGTWQKPKTYATNRSALAAFVKREYVEHHAVPMVTWHLNNPYMPPKWRNPKWDADAAYRFRYGMEGYPEEHRWVLREIVDGTGGPCGNGRIDGPGDMTFPNPRAWYEWCLKDAAAFCRTLKDEKGNRIPIVFRLFHECESDWFWWGAKSATCDDYIAAYRLTVDILRRELGADNVLFAYSPDRYWGSAGEEGKSGFLARYPGDAYCDMIGFDDYELGKDRDGPKPPKSADKTTASVIRRARIVSQIGRERGKICGIFESGVKDSVDTFYTELFKVMTAPGVEFAIATTYDGKWTWPKSEAGLADMKEFFARPEVIADRGGLDIVE